MTENSHQNSFCKGGFVLEILIVKHGFRGVDRNVTELSPGECFFCLKMGLRQVMFSDINI